MRGKLVVEKLLIIKANASREDLDESYVQSGILVCQLLNLTENFNIPLNSGAGCTLLKRTLLSRKIYTGMW